MPTSPTPFDYTNSVPKRLTTAVILAAGGSVRMGHPKPLLLVDGEPLILHHIRALSRICDAVVVVLGCGASDLRAVLPASVQVVINTDWKTTWPADSLRLALVEADLVGPCWVTPVDVPPAAPDTLRRMVGAGAPAVPVDRHGQPGHPVLLDDPMVKSIRRQAPAGGLRTLIASAPRIEVDATDVSQDFDDPEAFEAWGGG